MERYARVACDVCLSIVVDVEEGCLLDADRCSRSQWLGQLRHRCLVEFATIFLWILIPLSGGWGPRFCNWRGATLSIQVRISPPTMLPDHLKIPEALKTHPELVKRDLVLDYPLNIVSMSMPPTVVIHTHTPAFRAAYTPPTHSKRPTSS